MIIDGGYAYECRNCKRMDGWRLESSMKYISVAGLRKNSLVQNEYNRGESSIRMEEGGKCSIEVV